MLKKHVVVRLGGPQEIGTMHLYYNPRPVVSAHAKFYDQAIYSVRRAKIEPPSNLFDCDSVCTLNMLYPDLPWLLCRDVFFFFSFFSFALFIVHGSKDHLPKTVNICLG